MDVANDLGSPSPINAEDLENQPVTPERRISEEKLDVKPGEDWHQLDHTKTYINYANVKLEVKVEEDLDQKENGNIEENMIDIGNVMIDWKQYFAAGKYEFDLQEKSENTESMNCTNLISVEAELDDLNMNLLNNPNSLLNHPNDDYLCSKNKLMNTTCDCIQCPFMSESKSMVGLHVLKTHEDSSETRISESSDSSYQGENKDLVLNHIEQIHKIISNNSENEISSSENSQQSVSEASNLSNNFERDVFHGSEDNREYRNLHSVKRIKCCKCRYETSEQKLMDAHVLQHEVLATDKQEKSIFECSKYSFERGKQHRVNAPVAALNRETLRCRECSYVTNKKSHLKIHSVIHNKAKLFKCNKCNFETNYQKSLSRHNSAYHEDSENSSENFECTRCPFSTKNKSGFYEHIITCKSQTFKCNTCSFETDYIDSLLSHNSVCRVILNKVCIFKCSKCFYKAEDELLLKDHMKSKHPGDSKMLKCDKCYFETKSNRTFKTHIGLHMNPSIDKMLCSSTKRAFGANSSEQVNTSIKNTRNRSKILEIFKCSKCSYTSKYKAYLSRHLLKHTG